MSPTPKQPQHRTAHPKPSAKVEIPKQPQQPAADTEPEAEAATTEPEPTEQPTPAHLREQRVVERDEQLDDGAKHAPPVQQEQAMGPANVETAQIEFDGSSELQYWWTPATRDQAIQAEKDAQPMLAKHVTGNLISMNPDYQPD